MCEMISHCGRYWQNGLKKIQLYAVSKQLTLDLDTEIDWKQKDRNRYPMQIVIKRELGWLY